MPKSDHPSRKNPGAADKQAAIRSQKNAARGKQVWDNAKQCWTRIK